MSQTVNDIMHVVKFNGTNFSTWKFQLWLVIEQRDLLDIVLGIEKKPAPVLAPVDANNPNAEREITNAEAIKKWNLRDCTAKSLISTTMELRILSTIINCRTSAEMWAKITKQHQQDACENKHILHQKFFEYSFEEGNDIITHISTIEIMAAQLNGMNVQVDEAQIVTKIICSLPPSFRHFVSAWDSLSDDRKTVAFLTSRLLKEETRNKMYGGHTEMDAAFFFATE